MSKESYIRGFCKAAAAAGVDPQALVKFAEPKYKTNGKALVQRPFNSFGDHEYYTGIPSVWGRIKEVPDPDSWNPFATKEDVVYPSVGRYQGISFEDAKRDADRAERLIKGDNPQALWPLGWQLNRKRDEALTREEALAFLNAYKEALGATQALPKTTPSSVRDGFFHGKMHSLTNDNQAVSFPAQK